MARSPSVGRTVSTIPLRSRKRDFISIATTSNTSSCSSSSLQKNKAVKEKKTSFPANSVVAPTPSKFPVLTALKKRILNNSNDHKVLLKYSNLVPARRLRRYKRFLADVVLLNEIKKDEGVEAVGEKKWVAEDDGSVELNATEIATVYCPNTGPMVGLLEGLPNARVQLSKSSDPKRKYAYTLEMIQIHNGERNVWVGVHLTFANRMVEHALASRWLTELGHYDSVRREVKFAKNSRVDFVLTTNAKDGAIIHEQYVEVKSVTLAVDKLHKSSSRCAIFPDTISVRAQKHVTELADLLSATAKVQGSQEKKTSTYKLSGTIILLVQRDDCNEFAPSFQHDKKFAELCAVAAKSGIQLLAYACALEPDKTRNNGVVRFLGSLPLYKASYHL
ncbi:unnamed protein product [Peronospora belbahrii]|uniref:Sugar fermentation stimulation protein n=1 Tax=Peronospora belbahrii TaxID=622444 RepID=A0AAU9L311_9STRA|nr:unnamed protein product [Peronospora belbahrii]CAH0519824.1 unnamed protein product [Peronospora belbahrii]